jgi:arylsulfatase A-like enzyme
MNASTRRVLPVVLLAGLAASALRAAFWVRTKGYLQADLLQAGLVSFLDDLLVGASLALTLALLIAVLRGVPTLGKPLAALVLLTGLFALATDRLGSSSLATPGLESQAGILANSAVAALALVAVALSLWLGRDQARRPFWGLRLPFALGVLACTVLVGFGGHWALRGNPEARPSVVLISLDTLRADHVSAYGHSRETTPNLDRWAQDAVRFDQALTPFPWTLVSHASMLTGVYPSVHGAQRYTAVHKQIRTVTESFASAGYVTAAFVDGCVWLHPRYGYTDGFQVYRQVWGSIEDKNRELDEFLRDIGQQPLFLFLHYFDIHNDADQPYQSEAPFTGRFSSWFEGDFFARSGEGELSAMEKWQHDENPPALSDEELRYLKDLYDEGILYTDHFLGQTLAMLDQHPGIRDGGMIITSDHGEEFFEHGAFRHVQVYDECLRVPLWVRLADRAAAGRVVADAVSILDIAPTLAALAGIPFEAPIQSVSLLSYLQEAPPERQAFFVDNNQDPLSVWTPRYKLIQDRAGGTRLYDRSQDPEETQDRSADLPEVLKQLLDQVQQHRLTCDQLRESMGIQGSEKVQLSESEEAMLHAIGYVE